MDRGEDAEQVLAGELFAQAVADGQSARRVESDSGAATLRTELRRLGRSAGVRLRTARMDGLVVVARLDAALWQDDARTMRSKLTPRG